MEYQGNIIALTDPLMSFSEPGRWWTSANTAEAMQGVLLPFDWTFQAHGIEIGGRRSWYDIGLLREEEVYLPTDPNDSFMATFFGRVGINVTFSAGLFDRMPGGSGADVEMALLGFTRKEASWGGTDETRVSHVQEGMERMRTEQGGMLDEAEPEFVAWWRGRQADLASGRHDPLEAIAEAAARFDQAMHLHLRTRFILMMAQAQLTAALTGIGMPSSWALLTSAVGTAESQVADDLWALSKGTLGLEDMLARHGYHGPNEGAVSSRSWREDPAPVLQAAEALVGRSEAESPRNRRESTVAQRDAAERAFLDASKTPAEHADLLAFARRCIAQTEQGKKLTLLALDAARAATRLHGRDLVSKGVLERADDLYLFTVDEVTAGLPDGCSEVVAFRTERRNEYLQYDVPLTWEGNPEPIRVDQVPDVRPQVLEGTGVGGGTYEGVARIVRDVGRDQIEPGEVLVCSVTDPSWLTVFTVAGAVVVEIGGPTSHGAIVARELGLPCVMGITGATKLLADGDLVRVDGETGLVTVLHPVGRP